MAIDREAGEKRLSRAQWQIKRKRKTASKKKTKKKIKVEEGVSPRRIGNETVSTTRRRKKQKQGLRSADEMQNAVGGTERKKAKKPKYKQSKTEQQGGRRS